MIVTTVDDLEMLATDTAVVCTQVRRPNYSWARGKVFQKNAIPMNAPSYWTGGSMSLLSTHLAKIGRYEVVYTPDRGPGDEHHSMQELYEYRMLYHAHAAQWWLSQGLSVVKSWRHGDGGLCFGGGWFVVSAQLPTGQVSNHYRKWYWHYFAVPTVEQAPEWDGHTPEVAARRLQAMLF